MTEKPSFFKYMSNAQQHLGRLSNSSTADQPPQRNHSLAVTNILDQFRQEFSESYAGLDSDQKAELKGLLQSQDFETGLTNASNKIEYIHSSFDTHFDHFSPLHPSYPVLNAFGDALANNQLISPDKIDQVTRLLVQEVQQVI